MSQPLKSTILAHSLRWAALSAVLRTFHSVSAAGCDTCILLYQSQPKVAAKHFTLTLAGQPVNFHDNLTAALPANK
jgi:hypothetical protein